LERHFMVFFLWVFCTEGYAKGIDDHKDLRRSRGERTCAFVLTLNGLNASEGWKTL
jgi:hypothetical protein